VDKVTAWFVPAVMGAALRLRRFVPELQGRAALAGEDLHHATPWPWVAPTGP
jgi:hypothetical protein